MNLHELSPAAGSTRPAFRKGRGHGSGNGKTAGRGQKGQWARSGGGVRVGFEGGQMPLARRLPKRGFHNIFAKPLEAVNVSTLDAKFADGETVTVQALLEKGILSKCQYGVKILGNGSISKKLTVQASAFSASAAGSSSRARHSAIWEAMEPARPSCCSRSSFSRWADSRLCWMLLRSTATADSSSLIWACPPCISKRRRSASPCRRWTATCSG